LGTNTNCILSKLLVEVFNTNCSWFLAFFMEYNEIYFVQFHIAHLHLHGICHTTLSCSQSSLKDSRRSKKIRR
jgi:hypothetical protein